MDLDQHLFFAFVSVTCAPLTPYINHGAKSTSAEQSVTTSVSASYQQSHIRTGSPDAESRLATLTSDTNSWEILLSTHTFQNPTIRGSPWLNMLTALLSMALLEAREVARGRDARGAASTLKQPTDFRALHLANLGNGQLRTSAQTHTQTQCTKYLFRTAHTACSANVSPCTPPGSSALCSQPPRFIHLPQTDRPFSSEHKTQQGKATEARNPSSPRGPRGPLPTSKHRPWQESGLALGHHPSPSWEPGESRSATLATQLPLLKEKALKK